MIKKGLGKGLEALIPNISSSEKEIIEIKINDIEPNSEQPRKIFNEEALKTLSDSIREHGVVQPIIVTKINGRYKIVAGERRWRAARLAELKTIPAIIKEYAEKEVLEVALIENLQRQDLNPIEEAEAFQKLTEEYKLKQEEIAATIGRSRSAVANALRLLTLDNRVKEMVSCGSMSSGHARTLAAIKDKDIQYKMAVEFEKREMSVRQAEEFIKKLSKKSGVPAKKDNKVKYIEEETADKLKNLLGTKVYFQKGKNKGKIVIEYFTNQELDRILEMIFSIE